MDFKTDPKFSNIARPEELELRQYCWLNSTICLSEKNLIGFPNFLTSLPSGVSFLLHRSLDVLSPIMSREVLGFILSVRACLNDVGLALLVELAPVEGQYFPMSTGPNINTQLQVSWSFHSDIPVRFRFAFAADRWEPNNNSPSNGPRSSISWQLISQ